MDAAKARAIVDASYGKILAVDFIKEDGTPRTLVGRQGVMVGVKGTGAALRPETPAVKLFEMSRSQWRTVRLDRVTAIRAQGETHA